MYRIDLKLQQGTTKWYFSVCCYRHSRQNIMLLLSLPFCFEHCQNLPLCWLPHQADLWAAAVSHCSMLGLWGLHRLSAEIFEAMLLLLRAQQLLRCPAVIHSLHISFCKVILPQRTPPCWLRLLFFFLCLLICHRACWQMMRWHMEPAAVFVLRASLQEAITTLRKSTKGDFTFYNFRVISFYYFSILCSFVLMNLKI